MRSLARRGPFTYDDLQAMPDDGCRYELIDGGLLVTPSPNLPHQVAAFAVAKLLDAARPTDCIVLMAPMDVRFSDLTVLEPDALVVRREGLGRKDEAITTVPVLVVEVLSPTTRKIDLATKRLAYAANGVEHYWIVDADVPSVWALRLEAEDYVTASLATGEEELVLDAPFAVSIVPARLLDDLNE